VEEEVKEGGKSAMLAMLLWCCEVVMEERR